MAKGKNYNVNLRERCRRMCEAQGWRCYYCAVQMDLPKGRMDDHRPRMATREHLKKQADGGTCDPDNIVTACFRCNSARGDYTPEQYLAIMKNAREANLAAPLNLRSREKRANTLLSEAIKKRSEENV